MDCFMLLSRACCILMIFLRSKISVDMRFLVCLYYLKKTVKWRWYLVKNSECRSCLCYTLESHLVEAQLAVEGEFQNALLFNCQ